jgi:hypothetical protein
MLASNYGNCSVALAAQSQSHPSYHTCNVCRRVWPSSRSSYCANSGLKHWPATSSVRSIQATLQRWACLSACMASLGWQLANWCLHRSAWHESNVSKHPTLPRFVPHRKLPSLHDIGWAFHANTTTNLPMRSVTDHAVSDLDSPALPASLFHRCRSWTALQYVRDIADRGECLTFGSCR